MSWREDCVAGLRYDTTAPEREAEHIACATLCWEYNRTNPSDMTRREELLRKIFGKLGKNPYVEPTLFCGFGSNIEAGDNFFAIKNMHLQKCLTFGVHIKIAPLFLYTYLLHYVLHSKTCRLFSLGK